MSVSGMEPQPMPFGVYRWAETITREQGQLVRRVAGHTARFATEPEARGDLRLARQGRWVRPDAADWGCEPIGFTDPTPGRTMSASEYVQQVRSGGPGDPAAAPAIARSLSMFDQAAAELTERGPNVTT